MSQLRGKGPILQENLRNPRLEPFLDARDLVTRGFLTRSFSVMGIPLILKSVNPFEYNQIQERFVKLSTRSDHFHFNLLYLAYSVFKIEGQNFLKDRDQFLPYLEEHLVRWPLSLLGSLIQITSSFDQRYRVAISDLKFWFAQREARARWFAVRGLSLCDPRVTGIEGTQYLGLNEAQVAWAYLNSIQDIYDRNFTIMSAGRLAASAFNPKGMRRANASAEAHYRRNQERLENLRHGVDANITHLGEPVSGPETVEELLAEKRRSEAGIKDEHDLIMEAEAEKIRYHLALQEEALALKRSERPRDYDQPLVSTSQVVSSDQMQDMLLTQRKKINNPQPVIGANADPERINKILAYLPARKGLKIDPTVTPDDLLDLPPSVGYGPDEDPLH